MRLALISDIHGNLTALEAVLADIDSQQVETIHCLGDVIGYGPEPAACIELVEKRCTVKLLGNHEYVVMGLESLSQMNQAARKSAEWTCNQVGDREISLLAEYEMEHVIDDRYTLVHASPCEPEQWPYLLTISEVRAAFAAMQTPICFFGHTHLPTVFSLETDGTIRQRTPEVFTPEPDRRYLINVGSVGQPRDNDSRACYVILDTESGRVEYRRVEYDIAQTQDKMRQAEMPRMLIERLAVGR